MCCYLASSSMSEVLLTILKDWLDIHSFCRLNSTLIIKLRRLYQMWSFLSSFSHIIVHLRIVLLNIVFFARFLILCRNNCMVHNHLLRFFRIFIWAETGGCLSKFGLVTGIETRTIDLARKIKTRTHHLSMFWEWAWYWWYIEMSVHQILIGSAR